MGGNPCRYKIILNGGTIQAELHQLCYQVEDELIEIPYDVGEKMVEYLNEAENLVFKAKRLFLESQGFKGPWPKSLE